MVDRLHYIEDASTLATVLNTEFDLAINLDTGFSAGNLANLMKADSKYGFAYDKKGEIFLLNPESEPLLKYEMNLMEFASEYTFPYQTALMKCCGFDPAERSGMIFHLPDDARRFAAEFAGVHGIVSGDRPVVAIYLGCNPRFDKCCWSPRAVSFTAEYLQERLNAAVILLAGPQEKLLYRDCAVQCPPGTLEGGFDNSLLRFSALLELARVVIAPDSLGLHIALALGKKAVTLLPPNRKKEMELYNRGIILTSDAENHRDESDCLSGITPEEVFKAVESLLKC